ncbi:MAG: voltage-gated chloride channel, partial [Thermoprotei archaeon]
MVDVKKISEIPENYRNWLLLDLLGAIVGVFGGLGAIVFRTVISFNRWLFFDIILPKISFHVDNLNLGLIFLPAIGGLIVGTLVYRYAPETKGHGVPEVMEAVALKDGSIRKRVAFLKTLVSSITIGSGGSAGIVGPIAQIGASAGSLIGDILKLEPRDKRLLVVCGLSSGVAGTFNAPLGGTLFGMELFYHEVGLFNAVPVILASVIGATVVTSYYGPQLSLKAENLTFTNPIELPLYFLLGLFFGVLSVIWVKFFYKVEDFFDGLKIPGKYKATIGGALTGLIGMFYPTYGIMGVGYEGIDKALAGEISLNLLLSLGILKMISTAFTLGSGGSGGIFAPSLYIGTMLGGGLGIIFHYLFPSLVNKPFTYSLAGMAALFAGSAQAPLNVIIMITEMSNDYSLIPPLMLSSVTSFIVSLIFLKGSSIYTLKLERRGVKMRMGRSLILESIKVKEVMNRDVITVKANMPVSALELLVEETGHHGFPVIENGEL